MEAFFRTYKYLVEHVGSNVKRLLMKEINWSQRLIAIKGCRGVGKTTFLLQYAKEQFGADDKRCLYLNFNNFYFTEHTLFHFAGEFYAQGGRVLLLDQMFKYENWESELRQCYETYPQLQIIFSCSPVMRLTDENSQIADIVAVYSLRGYSFREFIFLETKREFHPYTLAEIIENHRVIENKIVKTINPAAHFQNYLHHGYYPFYSEKRNYSENLLKMMNMTLEVDVLLIKKIELKYLSKIRKLLYKLILAAPSAPNVSLLSDEIETSRSTIMNYIKYLSDARLVNLLYNEGDSFPKKPKLVYVQNTNLIHAVNPYNVAHDNECKTFLYNALSAKHKVNFGKKNTDFLVDGKYNLKYAERFPEKPSPKTIYVTEELKTTHDNEVPQWLFGFLH
jgi:predicted AAA+ superfamily ATPase